MSGKRVLALATGCFLAQPALAEEPADRLSTPLAAAFGAPPTIGDPMLSPDGSRVVFMQQDPQGTSMLLSLSLATGDIDVLLQGTEEGYDIFWCDFANETRLLCDLRQGIFDHPAHQQIAAVDIDGSDLRALRSLTSSRDLVMQEGVQDFIDCRGYDYLTDRPPFDRHPENSEQVLFLCEGDALLVDVYTSRLSDYSGAGDIGSRYRRQTIWVQHTGWPCCWFGGVVEPSPGVMGRHQRMFSNGHGFAQFYRGTRIQLDHWFVRDAIDAPWRVLFQIDPLAFEPPFRPVGYGTDLERVFNLDWNPETETWGLYRLDLGDEGENALVFAHEAIDIEFVETMGRYNRVVAVSFLDDRPRQAIIDSQVAGVYRVLATELSGIDVEIVDESWDQTRYLARVRAPNRAGEFVSIDLENETIDAVGPEYDHLADVALAETRVIELDASTTGTITAHLTLPPDAEGPVPAVILPRSGPNRDNLADPHYLVQFLAASGYAVLRVQNRADPETGLGWTIERAIPGWRQSADDVRDAANFLIANDITSPGLICGAGRDYGAYVALMTAIEYPELFNCVVSMAGITNPRETPGGSLVSQGPASDRLNQGSPLARADSIEAPVLLFHGKLDMELPIIDQMLAFERALERNDKDVVAVEYPNGRHALHREPDRMDMLARTRGFLAEHIGPPLTADEGGPDGLAWRP